MHFGQSEIRGISGLQHENLYSPKNNRYREKNRLHSRQQPCRSPRLTVIGIGLRKISTKFCLPSVRAARRHYRCLAFRLFYFILYHFYVYTIFHAEALGVSRQPKKGIYSGISNPDAERRGCCSHKVVAIGFNTLRYDAKRRYIKASARIKIPG